MTTNLDRGGQAGRARSAGAMSSIPCDRDTFLQYLRQSELLSARDMRKAIERIPDTDRGRVAARALVEAGLLTRFQAELLLVGRTHGFFLGQYKILDQLGQGGMGRVYKAVHMTMKRVVAIKVLAPQLVQTARAMKMFKHEVRAAAQLHHPNIITAFDANQLKGRHYLVMEYVDGPNLDQLVRQRTQLSVGLACEVIRQAAAGLQHAHELGLVHRDVKPANLLLKKAGRANAGALVKILDFGLARLQSTGEDSSREAKENTIIGTPDFLSPEQSRNQAAVDTRSDVYSLGCTFYFLLTGRVPFPGGPTLEKLMRHANEEPVTVALFRSDVPDEVLAVLNKMLAKKPEDRFQSLQEVAVLLAPFAKPSAADLDFSVVQNPIVSPSLPSSADLAAVKPAPSQAPTRGPQATVVPDNAPMTPDSEELSFPFEHEDDWRPHRLPGPMWLLILLTVVVCGLAVAAAVLFSQ